MKMVLFLALVTLAHAKCPNSCSGHGTCSIGDICSCYNEKTEMYTLEGDSTYNGAFSASGVNANEKSAWTGADCSLRTCPRGMSWNVPADFHDCLTSGCDGAFFDGIGGVHVYTHNANKLQYHNQLFTQVLSACTAAGNTCLNPYAVLDVDPTNPAANGVAKPVHRLIVADRGTNGWTNNYQVPVIELGMTVEGTVGTAAFAPGDTCIFSPSGSKYTITSTNAVLAGETLTGVLMVVWVNGVAVSNVGLTGSEFGTSGDATAACVCAAGACTFTYDRSDATNSVAQTTTALTISSAANYVPATDGYAAGAENTAQTNNALRNTGATDHKDNVECSDAGVCDRSSGTCQCFDGYEGSACQRTECPNDCSGQGTCMPNTLFASNAGVRYSGAWDSGLHYGCQCDLGFRGSDCSLKECPSFADPMYSSTHSDNGNTVGRDCSGRGICDYSTGLCQCFSGYTGADCSDVLALE